MMGILDSLGCRCALHGNRLEIDTSKMNGWRIEQKAMGKMRSSIMLLGALLGRFCEAGVYSPGGCMIGKRPIDWHLRALRALGAEIREPEPDGFLHAQTTGLRGAEIIFPFPSVGAVENALFAAVAAVGRTVLRGCAREPEIGQLCHFLNGMGASIRGIGTDALIIEGGLPLHDSRFVIGGDRIVAGTYLLAAASCSGEVIVDGVQTQELRALTGVLEHMGVSLYQEPELIYVHGGQRLRAVSVKTGPYPAFPTDLQPFLMGIIVSVLMGMILTLPISSAALGVILNLSGLAAGAATIGCCCNMVGFAVASYRENKIGGLLAQGIGTSMLQVPNIVRKPIIWVPAILSSAILGPVGTMILHMTSNATGSGMGTAGLVGQIMTWQTMTAVEPPMVVLVKIIVMQIALPAVVTLLISEFMRKKKWIQYGDMKLEL